MIFSPIPNRIFLYYNFHADPSVPSTKKPIPAQYVLEYLTLLYPQYDSCFSFRRLLKKTPSGKMDIYFYE